MTIQRNKILAILLTLIMSISISVNVMAQNAYPAQNTIFLMINGNEIVFKDSSPIVKDNVIFVPGEEFLKKLASNVKYNKETKTLSAKKNGMSIKISADSNELSITKNNVTNDIKIDSPAFTDENNILMIPVEPVTKNLGCKIGFSDYYSETSFILISDLDSIYKEIDGNYNIMNKYMEYNQKFSSSSYAIKGSFDFNYNVTDSETEIPISGNGTVEGITDTEKVNLDMAMELDLSKFEKALKDEGYLDEATKEMLKDISSIKINFIFDLSTGKYYIQSPLFEKLLGAEKNSWLMIDLNEMLSYSGLNFSDIMKMSKITNFEEYLKSIIKEISLDDFNSYFYAFNTYNTISSLFRDSNFKKSENSYISTYKEAEGIISYEFIFTTDENDNINGYKLNFEMNEEDYGTNFSMNISQDSSDNVIIKYLFEFADLLELKMNMNFQFTETNEKPLSKPNDESKIISAEDILF